MEARGTPCSSPPNLGVLQGPRHPIFNSSSALANILVPQSHKQPMPTSSLPGLNPDPTTSTPTGGDCEWATRREPSPTQGPRCEGRVHTVHQGMCLLYFSFGGGGAICTGYTHIRDPGMG